jgi:DNA polymerase III sliding clamp (beta) subunit (PCNA family)
MTIKTTVGKLKQAIKATLAAVSAKSCDLHVSGDQLHIKATSYMGFVRMKVEANGFIDKEAIGTLNGAVTNALFGSLSADTELVISPVEGGLRLKFGGATIKLKYVEAASSSDDLFAAASACNDRQLVAKATGADLILGFASAQFYAAHNDVRQYLCGVYIENRDGSLSMTGTNGFMLNRVDTKIACDLPAFEAILPTAAAQAVDMVLTPGDEVEIYQTGSGESLKLVWKTDKVCWVTCLVLGSYPNCTAFYEGESALKTSDWAASSKELAHAVQRIMAISEKRYVRLRAADETITVFSEDGEHKVEMPLRDELKDIQLPYERRNWEAAFSGDFIEEIARSVPSDLMVLRKGPNEADRLYARCLSAEGIVDNAWLSLVQPARI